MSAVSSQSGDSGRHALAEALGSVIAGKRAERRIGSQSALGRAVGVSKDTVMRWESGRRSVTVEDMFKLAEVFGMSAGELAEQVSHRRDELARDYKAVIRGWLADPATDSELQTRLVEISESRIPLKQRAALSASIISDRAAELSKQLGE